MKKYISLKMIDYKSLLMAIVLMNSLIISPLKEVLGINQNGNLYILSLELVVLILGVMFRSKYRLCIKSLYLMFLVIVLFLLTKLTTININYSFMQLLFYVIIPIFVAGQKLNSEKVLRYSMYISLSSIFSLNDLFGFQYEQLNQGSMGASYAVVNAVIVTMIHFKYFRNKANTLLKFCYLYNLFIMIKLISTANRGVILTMFCTICILYINNFDKDSNKTAINRKRILKVSILFVIITFIFINFESIINYLYDFCNRNFEQLPSFILKSNLFLEQNKLSNGREDIYIVLFDLIKNNPIWGYGLQTFSYYTRWVWPHNFLLQFLFEGGILFSIYPIYLSIKILYRVIFQKFSTSREFAMSALVVCICYPRYLISNDPWKGTAVWAMIGLACCQSKIKSKSKEENRNN